MEATAKLKTFIDSEQIRSCLARAARGEDRRDAELIESSYWLEAKVDFGVLRVETQVVSY